MVFLNHHRDPKEVKHFMFSLTILQDKDGICTFIIFYWLVPFSWCRSGLSKGLSMLHHFSTKVSNMSQASPDVFFFSLLFFSPQRHRRLGTFGDQCVVRCLRWAQEPRHQKIVMFFLSANLPVTRGGTQEVERKDKGPTMWNFTLLDLRTVRWLGKNRKKIP